MKTYPNFYNNLSLVEVKVCEILKDAAKNRRSDLHTPVLCSVDELNRPNARTVVLRGFFANEWLVLFHSDLRSKKIVEIRNNPNVSMVFYDKSKKIQVRINGKAKIDDKLKNSAWDKLTNWSRRCYLSMKSPGEKTLRANSGFENMYSKLAPSDEQSDLGKKNFSCVVVEINCIEWLYLASEGHRRALFNIIRNKKKLQVKKEWLVP